ncbi:N-acetyltransferase [Pseudoalteromonas citrea]|uniref:N-acetyltransferase n=1 Tax=Pseudoalteromonas citrea TaxID=43655 RepID=A0A5S3XRU9_9GAMM|nr:GNAT family protein [Pseudoalteromonas citrea]TMP44352.1 N-acetyltransferase [Pseudoalteromonas citrea]TMP60753.1 N-acetyltransferase [Pseudoalteromonas citrea]
MDVQIRPFQSTDGESFYSSVTESLAHLGTWLPWCHKDYSIEEAQEWVKYSIEQWQSGAEYNFVIEDLDSQKILGSVAINQMVPMHRCGNLGYWVNQSVLGQGVCVKAIKQLLHYAFADLGLQRIEIHVLEENYASNRVAEKLNATFEGVQRHKLFFKDRPYSAKCYSLIPADIGIE